jgi:hypothetical protein
MQYIFQEKDLPGNFFKLLSVKGEKTTIGDIQKNKIES